MPMPKKRRTNRKTGSHRAASWKLTQSTQTNKCSQCGEAVVPHQACSNCGFYKGKKVIVTHSEKKEKQKERRRQEEKENKA
jgi:large subunit ribosomal protein L32